MVSCMRDQLDNHIGLYNLGDGMYGESGDDGECRLVCECHELCGKDRRGGREMRHYDVACMHWSDFASDDHTFGPFQHRYIPMIGTYR